MVNAIFGLIGVVLGSVLTLAGEWGFRRRSAQKNREYLAIIVAFSLEKLGSECTKVALDDGLDRGQYDDDGCRALQSSAPTFSPEALDVEWKSVPAALMYEVFNLPNEMDAAEHRIEGAYEYAAGPPDYEEYFEERQISYAKIGLQAFELADQLRELGGLPKRELLDWDSVEALKATAKKVREERSARQM